MRFWSRLAARFHGRRPGIVYGRNYGVTLPGGATDPRRGERILSFLLGEELVGRRQVRIVHPEPLRSLLRVHDPAYLDSLQRPGSLTAIVGFDPGDAAQDSMLLSHREQVAGTVEATRLARTAGLAVNLGGGFHHALRARGQGFCVFHDIAVAISGLRAAGDTGRILVIDLDLHDGDGTRALFADDASVYTYSVHNRHLGSIEAKASTSLALGDAVDDERYLAALRSSLPDVISEFAPDRAYYLAGTDPAADDRLGNWRISADGLLERDLFVLGLLLDQTDPVPSVMVLAGGYGGEAWRYTARSLGAWRRVRPIEPPRTAEITLAHYRQTARLMQAAELTAEAVAQEWKLTGDDLASLTGTRKAGSRFLGYYSRHGIELALERNGFFDKLRTLGLERPRVELQFDDDPVHTLRLVADQNPRPPWIELRARIDRRTIPGAAVLFVEWLLLQNPESSFSGERPALPGQEHPGLGILRDVVSILVLVCERLSLDAVVFVPAHYHIAALAAGRFRFLEPDDQARFDALRNCLGARRLIEAVELLEQGRVRDRRGGRPFAWKPAPMILPVGPRLAERTLARQAERKPRTDRYRFTIADAGPAGLTRSEPP